MGSGKRMTFGNAGEATLSQWMADDARVCWVEKIEPWTLESQLISQLDRPLNLDQNRPNAFHTRLKELRAQARQRARALPVSSWAVGLADGLLSGPSLGRPRLIESSQRQPMTTGQQ